MRRVSAIVFLLLVTLLSSVAGFSLAQDATDEVKAPSANSVEEATAPDGMYAVFHTDLGVFVCKLFFQRVPLTVANFVGLAEGTRATIDPETRATVKKPFYDGLLFNRVVGGFLIQCGDPTGLGTGGPGYRFRDEFDPGLRHDRPGILSMANRGPNTNGSQFFITEKKVLSFDRRYSVFGRVVMGLDVVSAISSVPTNEERPKEDVHLRSLKIVRRGKKAKEFDAEAVFAQLKDLDAAQLVQLHSEQFHEKVDPLRKKARRQEDGSRVVKTRSGSGRRPHQGESIVTNYVCYLPDGSVVESTYRDETPKVLVAGRPRRGLDWERNFLDMKVGEERWVFLPAKLAFGHRGIPGVVPADTPLILQLELVSIGSDVPPSDLEAE